MAPVIYEFIDCDASVTDTENDDQHETNGESLGEEIRCKICGTHFMEWKFLDTHLNICYRRVCGVCGEEFTKETPCACKVNVPKPFECSYCCKCFTNMSALELHQTTHPPNHKKSYECSVCSKWFLNFSGMISHKRVHSGEKPFKCSECKSSFPQLSYLNAHKRIHEEKSILCEDCGETFHEASALAKHKRVHVKFYKRVAHTEQKSYRCSECGKCYRYLTHLISHRRIHSGEKPFQCSECELSFLKLSHLNVHKRIHGEKSILCEDCGETFYDRPTLTKHKRVHTLKKANKSKAHSSEIPYKCSQCGKSYLNYLPLARHVCNRGKNKQL